MRRLRASLFFREAWQALPVLKVVALGFWGASVNLAVKAVPDNPVQNHALRRGSVRPVDLLKGAKSRKGLSPRQPRGHTLLPELCRTTPPLFFTCYFIDGRVRENEL